MVAVGARSEPAFPRTPINIEIKGRTKAEGVEEYTKNAEVLAALLKASPRRDLIDDARVHPAQAGREGRVADHAQPGEAARERIAFTLGEPLEQQVGIQDAIAHGSLRRVAQLERADAPFARVGDTHLRLTAQSADGPAFIGLAPRADLARYLDGVPRSTVGSVDIGTGALPVAFCRIVCVCEICEVIWAWLSVVRCGWS